MLVISKSSSEDFYPRLPTLGPVGWITFLLCVVVTAFLAVGARSRHFASRSALPIRHRGVHLGEGYELVFALRRDCDPLPERGAYA